MCPSNSLGTLAGEGEVGGEGAPLVKRGVRVCPVPLVSPRAAGGRGLTLTPCRPGDARGHGDTPPPSLWPASRPPSGGGRENLAPGAADRPGPPVLYRGRPGSPSTHPRVQAGKGTRPLSVTSTVQQWPGCTPSPARADGKPPGPGRVGLSAPRHPCSSGRGLMWPPPPMPAPLGLSLPAGCFWPVGPDPQGWPHPSQFPGTKLWRSSGPPAAPGPSEAPPGSPWARPASGTARGQSGDPGPSGSPDAWLCEVGAEHVTLTGILIAFGLCLPGRLGGCGSPVGAPLSPPEGPVHSGHDGHLHG